MTIEKIQNGNALTVIIIGELNTLTAPDFERELMPALDGITDLTIDMTELTYITSAGLRVLLEAYQEIGENGSMKTIGVRPEIVEIFELTGFTEFLVINP